MRPTDLHSLRHQHQRSATDADQAEFAALQLGSAVVATGAYDDRVASAMDDFRPDNFETESWATDDITADSAVGAIQEEIERREALLGSAYPFTFSGGSLRYTPLPNNVYEYFLAISVAPSLTKGDFVELPRTFERLSAQIVAHYFGPDADVIHTGFPRDSDVGRAFKDAMAHVCTTYEEPKWQPQDYLPEEPVHGDNGVDFIVRKRPSDKRPIGQLFLLGQCACGNDWQTKFSDLLVERLDRWFNPFSLVAPVRMFATPHHVTDGWLYNSSQMAGLVFDRARLSIIASRAEARPLIEAWQARISAMIELVRQQKTGGSPTH
jgi:hypothetical protein